MELQTSFRQKKNDLQSTFRQLHLEVPWAHQAKYQKKITIDHALSTCTIHHRQNKKSNSVPSPVANWPISRKNSISKAVATGPISRKHSVASVVGNGFEKTKNNYNRK